MALKVLTKDSWRRSFSRVLLNGPPLSGKTTASLTMPRPCHLIVAPGELGYSSVEPEDDFRIYAWDYDPTKPNQPHREVWNELNETVQEVLTGKHGQVETLFFDGLHKLYDLVMRTEGWNSGMVDDREAGRQYTKYHDRFTTFMSKMLSSAIPLIAASCYDGLEPMEANSKITQIFPLLPGRMAKDVMGMFPVVFHTSQEQGRFYWSLKPAGRMQAAGMHVPARFLRVIPERIDVIVNPTTGEVQGGWHTLSSLLTDEALAVAMLGKPSATTAPKGKV